MATEEHAGGLQIHPMDQFVVKPLFIDHEPLTSVDPSAMTGLIPDGRSVHITAEQLTHFNEGKEVSVDLFAAGLQKIEWYTPTNVTLWMGIAVLAMVALLVLSTRRRAIVPSRGQSVAEMFYGFIHKMVEDVAGHEGLKFFPYVMTLFMFVFLSNMLGLIPMSFTTTSHIAVTAVLALLVFLTVTLVGLYRKGIGFLGMFWVSSAPLVLRPILAVIELISYFVRPLSHSIRLGGNLMAGHAVIKVFAGFAGAMGVASVVPIAAIAAIYGLETLVAAVQAYVFTILTCVYLRDAVGDAHH